MFGVKHLRNRIFTVIIYKYNAERCVIYNGIIYKDFRSAEGIK
ncbi:hypothetical protein MmTuc01_2702 [Methanosarcina mazei Tuc01]|uniref:Uncharacterized protein n=1 Tax=Methanosarcina mazei Tuc01 TaxID=1236903 RepID=M1Q093_METMZ|nr:hypothetical protein MmTuc01_2702 [Methanosarcina mazei Tuc01]